MFDSSFNNADQRQRLSELADGEADAGCVQRACAAWRESPELRASWHAYHLIGDVLRSEDLAHPVERDEAFLSSLRARLAAEPVVLAPAAAAVTTTPRPRRTWVAPAAMAAGFAAVAGVLVVLRVASPVGEGAQVNTLATAPAAAARVMPTASGAGEALVDAQGLVADGKLIRDARLERYLAAHKQYGGSSALTVPGVVLRSSATLAPDR